MARQFGGFLSDTDWQAHGLLRSEMTRNTIRDLLRNEPIYTNGDGLRERIFKQRIVVTGAGGSIGSELCRQIAPYDPSRLVLLGHGEHSIFTIAAELNRHFPALGIERVIADVRDRDRLDRVFSDLRPDIVFHAAAHKHVPLMEENVEEAIINNVLGTDNVVKVAIKNGTGTFVLVSTDKAVYPVSVMGATKRIAELIVARAAEISGGCFVSVRFGNVIRSRGSVLSVFEEQISRGGPVTVTHPEMRRYFMTIHEAVHLVLQAIKLGNGGELFVLDMGAPLKIVDIARVLIEDSGLVPDRDVKVIFTGVRPGERLNEDLFRDGDYEATQHPKILVLRNGGIGPPLTGFPDTARRTTNLDEQVGALAKAARLSDRAHIRELLKQIVPEYKEGALGSATRSLESLP